MKKKKIGFTAKSSLVSAKILQKVRNDVINFRRDMRTKLEEFAIESDDW